MIGEILIGLAAVAVGGAYLAGFLFVRRLRGRAQDDLEALVGAGQAVLVDRSTNCAGHDDPDTVQLRGAGVLALTDDALHFMLWMPRHRHLEIPRASIRAASATRSYRRAGFARASLRPLLRVEFHTKAGAEASIAWSVTDAEAWCDALDGPRD
jgi:hypothetical protein